MKRAALSLTLLSSFSAMAVPVAKVSKNLTKISSSAGYIRDYDYQVTDVATLGLKKEAMFAGMARNWLDLEDSICSNRAHLWAYDFSRFYGVKTGKIFIFFGESIWKDDKKGYMYHVAPYIVENGTEYVMEASYSDILKPLTVKEWAENETYDRINGNDCIELTDKDTDLTEYFYARHNLPEQRENGKPSSRCYIKKVPGHYWYPTSIAYHELKKDEDGDKIDFAPQTFDRDDVMAACKEAAGGKIGRLLGGGKAKCEKHLYSR